MGVVGGGKMGRGRGSRDAFAFFGLWEKGEGSFCLMFSAVLFFETGVWRESGTVA